MMRLPRPASPRELWKDIRALFGQRRPHQWFAAAAAIAIPTAIFLAFAVDFSDANQPREQIIYIESWPANRTIEETKERNALLKQGRDEAEAERKRQFQDLSDSMNKIGI